MTDDCQQAGVDTFMCEILGISQDKLAEITNSTLINLTFYAGSNDLEDIDTQLYIIHSDSPLTQEYVEKKLYEANRQLNIDYTEDTDEDEINTLGVCYAEDGLNIDTLIKGFATLTGLQVSIVSDSIFADNVYSIEVWQ